MKVVIKNWHAVAQWRWDIGNDDSEDDVCGICRVPYEGCCPACKMPGDDCPFDMGRMQSCLSYALPAEVDRNCVVEAAMPDGPTTLGDRGAQNRKQV
ncbi:anaphase-promoting complex subunit 11 RING-H2 finger-domain-containing protein, partial [Schizophyllum commune]